MNNLVKTDTIFGKRANIVGNISADLVLESLGKIYIKSRNSAKTLEELITSLVTEDPNVSTSRTKVVEGIENLDTSEYKLGTFVFDKLSNILYLFIDDLLLELINVAPEGTEYVKRSGDVMTGRLAIYVKDGPPLYVNSSELIENLNAEFLNGETASSFTRRKANENIEGKWKFKSPTAFEANTLFEKDIIANGSVGSANFASGFGGYGWRMDSDTNTLTVDNLVVRKLMQVYELVVNKISATNGSLWVTNAGKVSSVLKLEIRTSEFLNSDTEECKKFCNGIPQGQAFIKVDTLEALLEIDGKGLANANNIGESKNFLSIQTLKDAKLYVRTSTLDSDNPFNFSDIENEKRLTLYSLFAESFKYDCKFPIITREIYNNELRAQNGKEALLLDSSKIFFIWSYFKYFGNGDFYLVSFDGDSLPVFKPGDIVRCQKWTYGGIKYYDAVVCNIIKNAYIILLAPSFLDIKTIITYDKNLDPEKTIQTDKSNETLYSTTNRKNGDSLGVIEKNDSIVLMGNLWDPQRQNAVYITSTDDGAPYIDTLSGVNRPDYSVIYYIPLYDTLKLNKNSEEIPYTGDYYILDERYNNDEPAEYALLYNKNSQTYGFKKAISVSSTDESEYKITWLTTTPNKHSKLCLSQLSFNILLEDGGKILIDAILDSNNNRVEIEGSLILEEGLPMLQVASTRTTKVRIGNLDGILDELFDVDKLPYGYGLYGQNVFLTGEFHLSNGTSVADIGKDAITFAIAAKDATYNSLELLRQDRIRAENLLRNSVYSKRELYTAGIYINNDAQMVMWGNQILVATTKDEFDGKVPPTLLMENGKIKAKFIEVHDIHSDFGVDDYTRYWLDSKEVFRGWTSRNVGGVVELTDYYYYINDSNEEVLLTSEEVQKLTETTDYRTYGWWLKPEGDGYLALGNIRWDTKGELEILGSLKLLLGRGIYIYSTPNTYEPQGKLSTIINGDSAESLGAFNNLKKSRDIVIYLNLNNVNNNNIYSEDITIDASQISYNVEIYALDITPWLTRTERLLPVKITYTYTDNTTLTESFTVGSNNSWTSTTLNGIVKHIDIYIDGLFTGVFVNFKVSLITDLVTSLFGSNFLAVVPYERNFLWTGNDLFLVNYGGYYLKVTENGIFINNYSRGNISNIDTTEQINIFNLIASSIPREFKGYGRDGNTGITLTKYSPRVFYLALGDANRIYEIEAEANAIGIIFTIFREMYHTHTYATYVKFKNKILWHNQCAAEDALDYNEDSQELENEPMRVVYLGDSKWKSIDPHY